FLAVDDIDWIEAAGNYVRLHAGKQTHQMRATLSDMEGRLDSNLFVRIHRSTLVNITRVKEIQPTFHGDGVVILHDGSELPVSRTYRANLTA
ncbi:MAG: LytTR family DNA-binding domain-containing protein, partial [Phycisphaerae bacterium]